MGGGGVQDLSRVVVTLSETKGITTKTLRESCSQTHRGRSGFRQQNVKKAALEGQRM